MAQDVDLGNGATARIRSPWFVGLVGFFTLGLYLIFWWYFVNREMADYGRVRDTTELGDSPGLSVLADTLGWVVIVPGVITTVGTLQRAQKAQELTGVGSRLNGWLALALFIVIWPAYHAYVQSGLNGAWQTLETRAPIGPAQGSG